MSRYIDAEAFEYELKEIEAITAMTHKELGEDEEVGEISMPMFTIRNIMRRCSPIDIVRCKECKFREANKSIYRGAWYCSNHGDTVDLDDYCSYGERKEGE